MPEEYDGYQLTEYMDQDETVPWDWDDEEEDAPHD